jgi:transposase
VSISKEMEAKILRYYHVEKWKVGTIARQFRIHHSTVSRVLLNKGAIERARLEGKSMITPYLPFILETLGKHPRLTASRLYGMVRERDYPGGEDHFRALIARFRPKKVAEAYLRLRSLPGEQGQVDWGHFGYLAIGQAKRPLMAFVMVLSYSRKIFLRFYLNAQMASFLRGHEAAFEAFGGVPRVLLYDNLRSAVLEREGEAIRFNPTLLEFAAHYHFEPRPVAVARGNEKGRVERSIRYIRDNFFAAREFTNLEDLNQQADEWCERVAAERRCPEDRRLLVKEAFLQEKDKLIALPDYPYATDERVEVQVGKTPYLRFE